MLLTRRSEDATPSAEKEKAYNKEIISVHLHFFITFANKLSIMITFHRISSIADNYFNTMAMLYKSAFPPEQRRSMGELEQEIMTSERFHSCALLAKNEFVGFFNYWQFDTFYFVEHFAINTELRGKKLGSQTLKLFIDSIDFPVLIEVDMPTTAIAARRIKFYEKEGFHIVSNDYAQPPYRPLELMLPMLLMTNNEQFVSKHFDYLKETVYKEVYHYETSINQRST